MIIRKRAECWIVEGDKIWVGVKSGEIILPGGTLEDEETTIQAAIRETKEEIGVNPVNLKLISDDLIVRDGWGGWSHAQTWSYKADFGGFDKSIYGAGPEGKFHRVHLKISRLQSYFQTMLNKDDHMKEVAEKNLLLIESLS